MSRICASIPCIMTSLLFASDHVCVFIHDKIWLGKIHDVFRIYTFGMVFSVDFMKQLPEGLVCFFTIKNPSYPDYISKNERTTKKTTNSNRKSGWSALILILLFPFNSYDGKWCNVLRYSSELSIFISDW